ncbi:cation:proton antiporter [Hoeflea sp.]|uniref:cation:proton antiporter domain-containing protein n=1 Tax=Hoeflea sp. TaxID=1940281 RepID=UPI003BB11FBD
MEEEIVDAVKAVESAVTQVVEQGGHHADALISIAFAIAVAALLGLGFMRLKQPPLVGFILAGLLLGPTGVGVISTSDNVSLLAEMGVVVLLFFIGMELSIKAFVRSINQAVMVAGGQLLAAMVLASVLAFAIGASFSETIILGFIIALSSTVVAMKMLDEMGELRSESGRVAIGVLIAQDIAVVPMLILVSSLGGESIDFVSVALKVIVAVALLAGLLWWFGRNPKLKLPYARTIENNVDLLTIGSLAMCFSAAALSGLAGLSPVYGAFLAGIIVGNSTLRSKVIPVIEPIQSLLLVVFFLSIGLLIDLDFIAANIWLVLAAALLVVVLKTVLNILLLRVTGSEPKTALIAGLSMAQVGEFSFVLAAAGFASGALGSDIYRLAIAVTAISLLVSPVWFNLMERVENMASEGWGSYKQALANAYEGEIDGVENALWAIRARYRAARFALYQRRNRRAEAAQSRGSGPDEAEEDGAHTASADEEARETDAEANAMPAADATEISSAAASGDQSPSQAVKSEMSTTETAKPGASRAGTAKARTGQLATPKQQPVRGRRAAASKPKPAKPKPSPGNQGAEKPLRAKPAAAGRSGKSSTRKGAAKPATKTPKDD